MADRRRAEDGNTLALFPAAVMVMFVLASMAVDAALTFSAQRQLADIAAAAANDAATAFGASAYGPDPTIDPILAEERMAASVVRRTDADELAASCVVSVAPAGDQVRVSCTGRVRQLISPMRLLGIGSRDLGATATARAVAG